MSAVMRGAKGGDSQPHAATEAPDSLHSIAYARILDLVSEGEIQGFAHPANPLQDIYLDSTPLANADGSLNFQNVQVDSRSGTQTQTVLTGFPDVESANAVNVELKSTADWTQAITNLSLSAVRVMLSVPALSQSNTSTGDITGYSVQYEIDLQTDGGSWQTMLTSAFTGKTTSKYERSHRIDLPAATTGWTLRVHRITANQDKATIADTVMVESYTEIVDAKFAYPNSALVGVIIDASQFSSIPQRAYNLLGRIVSVPSNYDPIARTYTGAWDGTFKPAWTNNPAWIFYDLATNLRYGLGRYISAAQVNKWNLYNIAQYCDGMVSDGMGGQEPRFTCSLYLQKQADAYKVLQDLAAVFRGISFWGGGAINAVADMPGDPVYTYTAANVLNGKFTYQGSSKKTRYTVALVSWNDPADMGRAKVEFVPDRDGIARYGVNITQVTGTGATSRGQAQRVGLWTLLTSRLETETVTFGVGLDGTIAAPGQIVRIADPARAGKRQAGRISSATATAITVDATPTVAIGDNITCTLPTGVTETHAVIAVAGNVISVALPGFSQVPQSEAVWVIESASLVAQTFRVVSVVEDQSGQNLGFTITALAHNASKFAAIDSGAPIVIPPITAIPPSVQPAPATVTLESFPTFGQVLTQTTLTIQWDAADSAVYYRVEWRKDNGDWQQMPIQRGLSVDVHVWPGSYVARVAAVNASGVGSVATLSSAYVVVDQTQQSQVVASLGTEVATAQSDASAANAQLADIASDNILSPAEKPTVMRDYAVITAEQAGIDGQATAYSITTEKTAYDNAIATLTSYLNGLTAPTAWNDKSGNTAIVGTTFRSNFTAVYTTRQTLLNAIYAAAKGLADTAQNGVDSNQPLIINPYFTTGDLTGWTSDHGTVVFESGTNGPASASTTYARRNGSAGTPSEALRNLAKIPAYAGAVVKAQCSIRGINSPDGFAGVRISWRDATDTEISNVTGNTTTGNATNGTYVTGTAPSGAMFAHVECGFYNQTTGSYTVDNFAASSLADSLDQVPDGATYGHTVNSYLNAHRPVTNFADTFHPNKHLGNIPDDVGSERYAVANIDGNRRALVDFSQGHLNKNIDNISDGTTHSRTLSSALQNGVPLQFAGGKNVLPNGSFSSNIVGTTVGVAIAAGPICDGWNAAPASGQQAIYESSSTGTDVLIRFLGGTSVPANGAISSSFGTVQTFSCTGGWPFAFSVIRSGESTVGLPAGVTATLRTFIAWIRGDGSVSSTTILDANGNNTAPGTAYQTGAVPNDAVKFYITCQATVANANATPTVVGSAGQLPADMRWMNISVVFGNNLDTEVVDGTAYGRAAWADLYRDGGVNRIGLRIAGSGHILGDQRNVPSSLSRNLGIVRSATALTASSTGAVTVNAHTITLGSASIAYNAVTNAVTGLTQGQSYYIYAHDNYAGGTQTWNATTSYATANSYDDAYNAGLVTIPSSGSSGGGAGGGGCVCADMWLRRGLTARDLVKRWRWWRPYILRGQDGWHFVRQRPRIIQQPCCRITVADGSTLDCSTSTPVTTSTGESVLAPMLYGSFVMTDSGWQRVIEVELLPNTKEVVRICVGGHSFFAGTDPYRRISTHNVWKN